MTATPIESETQWYKMGDWMADTRLFGVPLLDMINFALSENEGGLTFTQEEMNSMPFEIQTRRSDDF